MINIKKTLTKHKKMYLLIAILAVLVFVVSLSSVKIYRQVKYNAEREKALEELGDWQLSLVMYDSEVDNGKTQITEDTWNATTSGSRTITVQINFSNSNVSQDIQPGELQISVDNLGVLYPTNSTGTSFAEVTSISADKVSSTDKKYDWSYTFDSTNQKYIFTNNNLIEANSNCEGTLQLAYIFYSYYLLNNSEITISANINDLIDSQNQLKFNFLQQKEAEVYMFIRIRLTHMMVWEIMQKIIYGLNII